MNEKNREEENQDLSEARKLSEKFENEEINFAEAVIERQEELVQEIVYDIEEDLKSLQNKGDDLEEDEKILLHKLEDKGEKLENLIQSLENESDPENISSIFREIDRVVNEIVELAEKVEDYLKRQNNVFMQELQRVQQIDLNLEEIINTIREELDITTEEAKKSIEDSQDNNLQILVTNWRQENSEVGNINQEIRKQIEKSEVIINIDKKIIEQILDIEGKIDDLIQLIVGLQNSEGSIQTLKIYKTLIKDLPRAKQKLNNIIGEERTQIEQIRERSDEAAQNAQRIMENRDIQTEEAQEKGFTVLQIIGAIAIIMVSVRLGLTFI